MKTQYEVIQWCKKTDITISVWNGKKRYFKNIEDAKLRIRTLRMFYPEVKEDTFIIRKREVTEWQEVEEL